MRIAIVGLRAPFGTEGGVEHVVGAVAPRLVRAGCEVTVFCRARYNPHGETTVQGVHLRNIETVYSKHLEAIVHTARALPEAARQHDLVHIHALGPALLSFLPKLQGCPTVVTVHGLDWKRAKWGLGARTILRLGEHAAKRFADRVLVVSSDLEAHFLEAHGVHAISVPNGAEIPAVPAPDQALDGLGLTSGRYHLYLGRLVPEKNLHLLIEAHAKANASWPLVIVGGHTHAEAYYAQLKELAHEHVHFLGPRYDEEKASLLGHAGSFCLPSEIEGFPVALLEAMAAARPCLVSDLPPHREIFESPHQGGEILPVGEIEAWSDALRRLEGMGDEALHTRGQQARERVKAAYSWDANANATLAVYRDLLGITDTPVEADQ